MPSPLPDLPDTPDAAPRRAGELPAQPIRFAPRAPRADASAAGADCAAHEPFALQVLGDDMQPEFTAGDVVIIEPEGMARDGSFVLARLDGDWALRRLDRDGAAWRLRTLRDGDRGVPIADLSCVRGIVIQRSKPGKRRLAKRYVA